MPPLHGPRGLRGTANKDSRPALSPVHRQAAPRRWPMPALGAPQLARRGASDGYGQDPALPSCARSLQRRWCSLCSVKVLKLVQP